MIRVNRGHMKRMKRRVKVIEIEFIGCFQNSNNSAFLP